jgi:hypothetical protein
MGEAAAFALGAGALCGIAADAPKQMAAARRGRRRREFWILRMRMIGDAMVCADMVRAILSRNLIV